MIESLPERLTDGTVTLRRYELDDAAALKESTETSHEHLRGFMPFAAQLPTDESVMGFIKPSVEDFRRDGNANYAITRTDDGTYLGSCGIHDRVGPGALEIGYWVDIRHIRRGIATAAARLLTDACFAAGADRVVIRCDVTNDASAAVARRLGFELAEVRPCEAIAPSQTGEEMVWLKVTSTGGSLGGQR
jgi:RimJ/RimL family protein N-acetyltransferase